MTTKALFVKLEAKPGKENEIAPALTLGQAAAWLLPQVSQSVDRRAEDLTKALVSIDHT